MSGMFWGMFRDSIIYVLLSLIHFYIVTKNVFLASWEIGMLLLRKNKRGTTEPDIPAVPPETT